LVDRIRKELEFYSNLLEGFRPGNLIYDIGANHGSKTSIFLRLGARVIAVEPDEDNRTILKDMFLTKRMVPKPVVIVGKAVSDTATTETMWIDKPGSALNTLSEKWADTLKTDERKRFDTTFTFKDCVKVQTTTLGDLFSSYGLPFFVKIDVEGYELHVLKGLRQPVPFLSFEVNLPEFQAEGLECVELLERQDAEGTFNYAVDCGDGLVLQKWLRPREFMPVFSDCRQKSIEVFWKSSLAPRQASVA